MNQQRRSLMQFTALVGLMAGAGLITKAEAATWNAAAFKAKSMDELYKVLGTSAPQASNAVVLTAPDIAENGAVVPVKVEAKGNVTELAILVANNPSPLAAMFLVSAAAEPYAVTRVKMGRTSDIFGMAKIDGKWGMTKKEVKVTLGGCGG